MVSTSLFHTYTYIYLQHITPFQRLSHTLKYLNSLPPLCKWNPFPVQIKHYSLLDIPMVRLARHKTNPMHSWRNMAQYIHLLELVEQFTWQFAHEKIIWGVYLQRCSSSCSEKMQNVCILDDMRTCVPGAHFTNNFSITIQLWWKFHFALIQKLIKWSLQYLAHGTTAGLSWRVPNFVAIWSPVLELELDEISIEFELWWKNR